MTTCQSARALVVVDQHTGSPRWASQRGEEVLVGLDLFPRALREIQALHDRSIAVTLLVPEHSSSRSHVCGSSVKIPAVQAVQIGTELSHYISELAEHSVVLISADRQLRAQALKLGWTASPSIHFARALLEGERLRYALVEAVMPDRLPPQLLRCWYNSAPEGPLSLVLGTCSAIVELGARGYRLSLLDLDPACSDPLIVNVDRWTGADKRAVCASPWLAIRGQRVFVALDAETQTDALGLHGAHGHFEQPLLAGADEGDAPALLDLARAEVIAHRIPSDHLNIDRIKPSFCRVSCNVTPAELQFSIDRYTGATDPGGGPIRSRHISHPDNARVVARLLTDLRALGYCAYRHNFSYLGHTYSNVIADRPGAGLLTLSPDVREQARRALVRHATLGVPLKEAFADLRLNLEHDWNVARLEREFHLEAWYPWWRIPCLLGASGLT